MPKKRPRARQASRKAPAKKSVPMKHKFTRGLYGWITHTDLASLDPAATKAWCARVLGWDFKPSFSGPAGEIHMFSYSKKGGGAVRPVNSPEVPGSVPYIHVADAAASFAEALAAGAE